MSYIAFILSDKSLTTYLNSRNNHDIYKVVNSWDRRFDKSIRLKINTVALYKWNPVTEHWKICQYFKHLGWVIIRLVWYQNATLLLHEFIFLTFSLARIFFSLHFLPHQDSHMLAYVITLITIFHSDTSIYIVGTGEAARKRKKKKKEGAYSLATTRKSIRPLLIFSNCLEGLNLAFTEDFSNFSETFHLCATTYPFMSATEVFSRGNATKIRVLSIVYFSQTRLQLWTSLRFSSLSLLIG